MPYFFQENLDQNLFTLTSEESKHISKSMRLKEGDIVLITNGKGRLAKAALTSVQKDCCEVEIVDQFIHNQQNMNKLHLAVAPTKNPERMEWMVEKAVEIGAFQISFVICERSERKHIDLNRLHRIAIAALKQSQGIWLPKIRATSYSQFLNESILFTADKYIACCEDKAQSTEIAKINYQHQDAVFLIGPEGDFAPQEILAAKNHGFLPITLGEKILRTETAALFVGCCYVAFYYI
jgi:16S rRNA (uracil1498-N3)-methyltransferase